MINQTISHYKILEKLGEGGMGVVYKAEDIRLKRTVALKFLPQHLIVDEEAKARFINEAQSASALDHNNICNIHEIDETEDGQLFICMAYYDGETLRERVAKSGVRVAEAIDIASQIAAGLACAHEAGIVHRDIKPSNIMITKQGVAKILDFGLAKLAGQHITKTGSTPGTVAYMSPEQAQARPTDHRTDIWSLGVILYEMLTSELPFKGDFDQVVMYSIVNEEHEPISRLRPEVPAKLEQIATRCLEKDPSDRYQRADALLVELNSTTKDSESQQLGIKEKPIRAGLRKKKRTLPYIVVATLLILSIIAGYYFLTGRETAITSIAVLPLENLSGDPEQEYFVDGIHNELMWGENYNRHLRDVLALHTDVAQDIAQQIAAVITPLEQARLARVRVVDPEAHILYLKGNFQMGKENEAAFRQAVEHYQQAIAIDSSYAPAYAGLAMAYIELGSWSASLPPQAVHARAKAAANAALARDSTLAEAHIALGRIKHLFEWDWAGAEASFRHGVALNPSATPAQLIYSNYLHSMGRHEEAVAIARQTVQRDPLSPNAYIHLAWPLDYLGRHTEAQEQYRKGVELAPDWIAPYLLLTESYLKMGRSAEASGHLEKTDSLLERGGWANWIAPRLSTIYARASRRADALRLLNELETRAEKEYVSANALAVVYLHLDQKEKALELFEQGYEARDVQLVWLKVHWLYDPLRDDPRFQDLLRRMNFP